MSPLPKKMNGDPTPVAGGRDMPAFLRRRGLPPVPTNTDELAKDILLLLSLHPNLSVNFRADVVSKMTEDDKLALLGDLKDALGIKPLKTA